MAEESKRTESGIISMDDFAKIKLRVGRVLEVADHPNADKLLVLKVDLGDERRQICAGLKGHYTAAQLIGRNLAIVTNLPPRKMRGQLSEGMLLAAVTSGESRVVVLTTESHIDPGTPIS